MKKVLLTGGAGFIGTNLCIKLLENGYRVTVIDNLSEQIHGQKPEKTSHSFFRILDQINFIHGDVTCQSDMQKAIDDNEIIVHLAAETGTGQSMYETKKYVGTNVMGTATLLDILINNQHQVKKVLVASSRAIYGEGKYVSKELGIIYPEPRNNNDMKNGEFEVKYEGCTNPLQSMATDENSKLHPISVYGISKLNQEQMVMTVCKSIGIPCVSLRFQNVYGPGQSLSNPYTGILSIFSTQIKNGNMINIFEDGKESRDFVYISDAVEAIILAIESEKANFEIFNVGTGIHIDIFTLAKTLLENFKTDVPLVISGNFRIGDIRHNYADLSKIKKMLNFSPKVTFDEGIKIFTEWVNNQVINKGRYKESINEMKEKGLLV